MYEMGTRAFAGGHVIDGSGHGGLSSRHDFLVINHFARSTPWLHTAAAVYGVYGPVLFAALLLWGVWAARHTGDVRRMARTLWAGIAAVIAVGINQPLGHAVAEPRPFQVLAHPLVLVARSHDYSFPSDHAVMAGAVAAGLLLAGGRALGGFAAIAAFALAFARVYIGVHWPVDVVAGLVLGAVVAVAGLPLAALLERLLRALANTRLGGMLVRTA